MAAQKSKGLSWIPAFAFLAVGALIGIVIFAIIEIEFLTLAKDGGHLRMSYADFIAILLTGVAVLVTIFGVVIAIFAFIGYATMGTIRLTYHAPLPIYPL